MKSQTILLAFVIVVSISTCSGAELSTMRNESSQVNNTTPATNTSAPRSPSSYSMMDTALYLRAVMNAINNYENISIHPQHPVISGGNQKKAAYAQVNNTEVTNFRELVRYVINSRAAPAIKTVLSNLDRDLFKLFTPDTSVTTTAAYNVIFQHEYPTEEPSTSAAPSTTKKDGIRNLVDGEDDDDDDENNDEVGKVGKLSSVGSSYKIIMRAKKTTPKSNIVQEDDEDESVVFDKLKDLKKHA